MATARCPDLRSPVDTSTHCNSLAHCVASSPSDARSRRCHGRTVFPTTIRLSNHRAHELHSAQSPSNTVIRRGASTTGTLVVTSVGCSAVLRVLLSPRIVVLHVFTIVLVVTMLSLSSWQWDRHRERAEFNDEVRARAAEVIRPLTDVLEEHPEPVDAQWYTVEASGSYTEPTMRLVNVSQDGVAGYDVVTPLVLDDGRILIVNRGFLPLSQDMPTVEIGDRVSVVGRVRTTDERRFGEVDNSPQATLTDIQRIDLALLDEAIDGEVLDVSIDALSSNPTDDARLAPVAAPTLSSGPHLSYTVQWILFSLCAIGAWALLVRRALRAASAGNEA